MCSQQLSGQLAAAGHRALGALVRKTYGWKASEDII
jgi:hypothetical protein